MIRNLDQWWSLKTLVKAQEPGQMLEAHGLGIKRLYPFSVAFACALASLCMVCHKSGQFPGTNLVKNRGYETGQSRKMGRARRPECNACQCRLCRDFSNPGRPAKLDESVSPSCLVRLDVVTISRPFEIIIVSAFCLWTICSISVMRFVGSARADHHKATRVISSRKETRLKSTFSFCRSLVHSLSLFGSVRVLCCLERFWLCHHVFLAKSTKVCC